MAERSPIVYYADWMRWAPIDRRPLNVVFLTSIRDVGSCDRNGRMLETGNGLRYMEGIIERTIKETFPGGALADYVHVAGVITDDIERDMQDSSYSALPEPGRDWIYPFDLATPEGELVRNMTYNIPSSFRLLPVQAVEERRQLKHEFEWTVLQKMRELGGDVIISDHYMARIDYLIGEFGLYGRVLNIHPAVTVEGHPFCFRGKTPTADAIERARRGVPIKTGATLHIIDEVIDHGPPIAYLAGTPVFPTDEAQWLRYRNYTLAKLPLFTAGLAHYASVIYPYLNELNLSALGPFSARHRLYGVRSNANQYENILFS